MQTCESNLHRVALHDLLEEHTSLGVHGIRMGRNSYEWMFFMNKSRPPVVQDSAMHEAPASASRQARDALLKIIPSTPPADWKERVPLTTAPDAPDAAPAHLSPGLHMADESTLRSSVVTLVICGIFMLAGPMLILSRSSPWS